MKICQNTLDRRAFELILPDSSATIIDRIKYLIRFVRKTQASFARMLGCDPASLSKMLSGRIPVSDRTIDRIVASVGCSKPWLITGRGIPFPKSDEELSLRNINRGVSAITDPEVCNYNMIGAPVYDIDATAGHAELASMFTDERIIGRLFLPSINPRNPIIRVSGNSMSPKIRDGAWISIRPISVDAPIFWGQPYLVVTDDYRMVKVLRRHPDDSKVILHSVNPDYDDMDLPRDAIRSLFFVESVITYDLFA